MEKRVQNRIGMTRYKSHSVSIPHPKKGPFNFVLTVVEKQSFDCGHWVCGLDISNSGHNIIAASYDGYIYKLSKKQENDYSFKNIFQIPVEVESICFSRDEESIILVGGKDGYVYVCDIVKVKLIKSVKIHFRSVSIKRALQKN
eukprot:TRINITY_DN9624_c1_g1_i1.p1 TRINITY_DN9624_c1_g1~~TRINITY_DN9624_c1_g1_i1.p1  ORF type:complete len:144 (+),score=18.99 TRINITY_DN9624_c1_g1_i1:148-579(+)